jgi:SAM-dependent methyltransferase
LYRAGFKNLLGVDPFVPEDATPEPGVQVRRQHLRDVGGAFDLVMFNHSFEHMPDPGSVIREAFRLTKPGHFTLIRTPVGGTFAWRRYGTKWVQLDAPRHLYIHTERSIERLARAAGFELSAVDYDSTDFQFWGSERYECELPLFPHERGLSAQDLKQRLEQAKLRENPGHSQSERAQALNLKKDGDQACFFLKRPVERGSS